MAKLYKFSSKRDARRALKLAAAINEGLERELEQATFKLAQTQSELRYAQPYSENLRDEITALKEVTSIVALDLTNTRTALQVSKAETAELQGRLDAITQRVNEVTTYTSTYLIVWPWQRAVVKYMREVLSDLGWLAQPHGDDNAAK